MVWSQTTELRRQTRPPRGMWLTPLRAHQLSSRLDGRLSGSTALLRSAWLDSCRKQWNLLAPLIFPQVLVALSLAEHTLRRL